MRVVTDSSPRCYLILIDQILLMQMMFNEFYLFRKRSLVSLPAKALHLPFASGSLSPPGCLKVREVVGESDPQLDRLHIGERDALLLARQIKADVVVVDEKLARRIAREQGLNVTGLIGPLDEAATRGIVDLLSAVERLRQTSFCASPHPLKMLLDRHYYHHRYSAK